MTGKVTSAVRDTTTKAMLANKLSAIAPSSSACQIFPARSSATIGIGQRHRAQREFLALIDVVLDEDAARGVRVRLQRQVRDANVTSQDITISSVQDTRKATNTQMPRSRTLEMIEQHRQHQELRRRKHRVEPRSPCRVRPQRADQRQQRTARSAAPRSGAAANAGRRAGRETARRRPASRPTKIAASEVDHGSDDRGQDRKHVDRRHPGTPDRATASPAAPNGECRGDHRSRPPPRARGSPARSCCGLAGYRPATPRRHWPRRSRGRRPVSRV